MNPCCEERSLRELVSDEHGTDQLGRPIRKTTERCLACGRKHYTLEAEPVPLVAAQAPVG